jgi:molybdopterin molybdotransferase
VALISVAEALNRVLAHAQARPPEEVALEDANGRVLARDLTALRTQPPADVSAMDGYAVRTADIANAPLGLKLSARSRPEGRLPLSSAPARPRGFLLAA